MKQYDTNASGRLERDQVIKLLTDLEDGGKGNPPTDEELNFVLRRAGSADDNLEAAELIPALAAWTSYKVRAGFCCLCSPLAPDAVVRTGEQAVYRCSDG